MLAACKGKGLQNRVWVYITRVQTYHIYHRLCLSILDEFALFSHPFLPKFSILAGDIDFF